MKQYCKLIIKDRERKRQEIQLCNATLAACGYCPGKNIIDPPQVHRQAEYVYNVGQEIIRFKFTQWIRKTELLPVRCADPDRWMSMISNFRQWNG